jgi:hypothetical protein
VASSAAVADAKHAEIANTAHGVVGAEPFGGGLLLRDKRPVPADSPGAPAAACPTRRST